MKRPLILITNDDGIFAPGIRLLIETIAALGDVIVVAPDSPRSGQGHAITIENPVRLNKVKVLEGIETYECTGTPVDCVKLAKHILLKDRKVDLCLSGINHGMNASISIIYSGTMSAAMEAALEGIPSIGFSTFDHSFEANLSHLIPFVSNIVKKVLEEGMGNTKLLNINFPKGVQSPFKGIKICHQAKGRWVEDFLEGTDPRGEKYYWLTGKFILEDSDENCDILALKAGYVSIVPAISDLTDYKAMPSLAHLAML